MAGNLRDIDRRRKSAQSIKKITRAMELIAASRVAKAQQRMKASRPYAEAITAALSELSSAATPLASRGRDARPGNSSVVGSGLAHSYLGARPQRRRAAVIVVTSDRGLAGAYSASVLRLAEELFASLRADNVEPAVFVTGRKGAAFYKFRRRDLAGQWAGFSDTPTYDNAKEVADATLRAFTSGDADEIYIVFTDFVSALSQRPVVRRLLPLEVVEVDAPVEEAPRPLYEYEPDSETVLDALLPRYIEARVFNAFLESAASELSARRQAMSTATENAGDLITEYTRQYNSARQAAITQELMEVVGAAEAFKAKP